MHILLKDKYIYVKKHEDIKKKMYFCKSKE